MSAGLNVYVVVVVTALVVDVVEPYENEPVVYGIARAGAVKIAKPVVATRAPSILFISKTPDYA